MCLVCWHIQWAGLAQAKYHWTGGPENLEHLPDQNQLPDSGEGRSLPCDLKNCTPPPSKKKL